MQAWGLSETLSKAFLRCDLRQNGNDFLPSFVQHRAWCMPVYAAGDATSFEPLKTEPAPSW